MTDSEPYPDDLLRAVGRVGVHFSNLERMVERCVHALLGVSQEQADALTADLAFSQLTKILAALYDLRYRSDQQRTSRFQVLIKSIGQAGTDRNRVMHSIYAVGDTQGKFTWLKTTIRKGRLRYSIERKRIREIESVVERIQRAGTELVAVLTDILANH